MQFLQFLGVLIVSYLGLLAGYFLNRIAKEEMPNSKKYIYWMQTAIFFALVVIFLVWLKSHWLVIALAAIWFVFEVVLIKPFRKELVHHVVYGLLVVYVLFGIILALLVDSEYFTLSAGLIFLYGVSAGSFYTQKKGDWLMLLKYNLLYFLAGIIAYFAF